MAKKDNFATINLFIFVFTSARVSEGTKNSLSLLLSALSLLFDLGCCEFSFSSVLCAFNSAVPLLINLSAGRYRRGLMMLFEEGKSSSFSREKCFPFVIFSLNILAMVLQVLYFASVWWGKLSSSIVGFRHKKLSSQQKNERTKGEETKVFLSSVEIYHFSPPPTSSLSLFVILHGPAGSVQFMCKSISSLFYQH